MLVRKRTNMAISCVSDRMHLRIQISNLSSRCSHAALCAARGVRLHKHSMRLTSDTTRHEEAPEVIQCL